jgi:hypothetical protein
MVAARKIRRRRDRARIVPGELEKQARLSELEIAFEGSGDSMLAYLPKHAHLRTDGGSLEWWGVCV